MSFKEKPIFYFEKAGPENTEKTLEVAEKRVKELGLKNIIIASTRGGTGMKAAERFKDMGLEVIVVTHAAAPEYEKEDREELERGWVKLLISGHTLSQGIGDSMRSKYDGWDVQRVAAETLRRFCQGMKVIVEMAMMAANAGLVSEGEDVMAIAGTGKGADTAVVLTAVRSNKFLDMKIKEIVAMPRSREKYE